LIGISNPCVHALSMLKPKKQKIYLWNKTDFNQPNLNMTQFSETFLHCYSIDTPIQDLWDIFKMQCHDCLDLVPHIFSTKPVRNPWINNHVKRLTYKKQCLYNKAKSTQLQSDLLDYEDIKKQVQRECRRAHNNYVLNMINPDNNNSSGHTYIKSKKSDHCGISSSSCNR